MTTTALRNRTIAPLVALLSGLVLSGCATHGMKETRERMISQVFEVRDAQGIDLEIYAGEIRLHQATERTVRVEGKVKMKGRDFKALDRYLDDIEPEVEYGDRMKITLPRPAHGRRYVAELDITLPKDLDLDVALRYGELQADLDLPAQTRLHVGAGEVSLDLPSDTHARVNARAKVGDVSVGGFDTLQGHAKRRRLVGARFNGIIGDENAPPESELEVKVAAGAVEINGEDPEEGD